MQGHTQPTAARKPTKLLYSNAACSLLTGALLLQLFPTSVRASGLGLCAMASRFGAVLAPYLAVDLATAGKPGVAELMIAGCCLVAAGLVLALPRETAKQQLQVWAAPALQVCAARPASCQAVRGAPKRPAAASTAEALACTT